MSEHSYNRATSCSPWNMDATFPSVLYCMDSATSHSASLTKEVLYTIDNSPLMYYTDQTITQATDSYGDQHNIHLTLPPPPPPPAKPPLFHEELLLTQLPQWTRLWSLTVIDMVSSILYTWHSTHPPPPKHLWDFMKNCSLPSLHGGDSGHWRWFMWWAA